MRGVIDKATRVEWLLAHSNLWAEYHRYVLPDQQAAIEACVMRAMVREGLYLRRSYRLSPKCGLREIIHAAWIEQRTRAKAGVSSAASTETPECASVTASPGRS